MVVQVRPFVSPWFLTFLAKNENFLTFIFGDAPVDSEKADHDDVEVQRLFCKESFLPPTLLK